MSSSMSRRRVEPPEDPPEPDEPDDEEEDFPVLELVEYLLPPEPVDSSRTSVPKSVHELHSSSSAPSTFVVVSEVWSAPHISHWGIRDANAPDGIKGAPGRSRRTGRPRVRRRPPRSIVPRPVPTCRRGRQGRYGRPRHQLDHPGYDPCAPLEELHAPRAARRGVQRRGDRPLPPRLRGHPGDRSGR